MERKELTGLESIYISEFLETYGIQLFEGTRIKTINEIRGEVFEILPTIPKEERAELIKFLKEYKRSQ